PGVFYPRNPYHMYHPPPPPPHHAGYEGRTEHYQPPPPRYDQAEGGHQQQGGGGNGVNVTTGPGLSPQNPRSGSRHRGERMSFAQHAPIGRRSSEVR
ncbi:hypothetical protein KEM54_003645, partial [Ascosphaera aggregata]